jgi:hypothetical protein
MATTSQIDAAANPWRAPVGVNKLHVESPLLSLPSHAEEQRERARAARRFAAGYAETYQGAGRDREASAVLHLRRDKAAGGVHA